MRLALSTSTFVITSVVTQFAKGGSSEYFVYAAFVITSVVTQFARGGSSEYFFYLCPYPRQQLWMLRQLPQSRCDAVTCASGTSVSGTSTVL